MDPQPGDDLLGDDDRPQPVERRIRLDVYHHFEGPVDLRVTLADVIDIDIDVTGEIAVKVKEPTPVPASIHLVPGTPVTIRPKEPPHA